MTDNEIVKAKKIIKDLHAYCFCSQIFFKAQGYNFKESDFVCLNNLIDNLNRQKAEIKNLNHNLKCVKDHKEKLIDQSKRQRTEIERLTALNCNKLDKIHNLKIDVANATGIDQKTLSNYETGKTNPDSYSIIRLAEFFQVTTDYLLGFSNSSINSINLSGFKLSFVNLLYVASQRNEFFDVNILLTSSVITPIISSN